MKRKARARPFALALALALLGAGAARQGVATAPPATVGDSIYPGLGQAGLDVQHDDIELTVDQPGTPGLRVTSRLRLGATRVLDAVALDYLDGPTVLGVRLNGRAVPWTLDRAAGKLRVALPTPLRPGETAELEVRAAGPAGGQPDPVLGIRLGWQAVPGERAANFNLSEPDGTRTFLPVNDHPSDPATYTVRLTVPAGFEAAASGVLQGVTVGVGGARTFTFVQERPIPTYALALHVGRLTRVDSPPVPVGPDGAPVARRDYFPATSDESVRRPYARQDEMLRVLSGLFGPYPFAAAGSAVVASRLPALETATLSTVSEASSFERVIVHELAHQWFGDAVVLGDWADVWLNEGFATYAELLWLSSQGDNSDTIAAAWYERLRARGSRPLVARTEAQLFDASAYQRGALALHALRAAVGDERFFAFLRGYAETFSARPVRTADLLAYVRQTLGPVPETVLRVWVESPTLPPRPVVVGGVGSGK